LPTIAFTGPFRHRVRTEHVARDVAQVDDQHALRRQQQVVDMQRAAAAVRHEHVADEIHRHAGDPREPHAALTTRAIPTPDEHAEHADQHAEQHGSSRQGARIDRSEVDVQVDVQAPAPDASPPAGADNTARSAA
jgi:hypothetical protein